MRDAAGSDGSGARVVLVTRAGCHLCEEGRAVLARAAAARGTAWAEVDVDADAELLRRYGEQVPVLLVDGEPRDAGRLDEARVAAALAGRRWWRRRRTPPARPRPEG